MAEYREAVAEAWGGHGKRNAFSRYSAPENLYRLGELLGSSAKRMLGAASDADSDACAEIASML